MSYDPTIDHLAVVTTARTKWDGMTPGPTRAWTVINETCLALQARGEDAGLTAKASGNAYLGYSTDIISYHDGTWVDALADSDGIAEPRWDVHAGGDASLWRPPLGDVPAPPEPDPPPPPGDCDECSLLQTMVEALVGLRDDLAVVKSELASANDQRQVLIAELARIFSRLEATPTLEQLTRTPVLVKFKW